MVLRCRARPQGERVAAGVCVRLGGGVCVVGGWGWVVVGRGRIEDRGVLQCLRQDRDGRQKKKKKNRASLISRVRTGAHLGATQQAPHCARTPVAYEIKRTFITRL